jgi:hypothetical protein
MVRSRTGVVGAASLNPNDMFAVRLGRVIESTFNSQKASLSIHFERAILRVRPYCCFRSSTVSLNTPPLYFDPLSVMSAQFSSQPSPSIRSWTSC